MNSEVIQLNTLRGVVKHTLFAYYTILFDRIRGRDVFLQARLQYHHLLYVSVPRGSTKLKQTSQYKKNSFSFSCVCRINLSQKYTSVISVSYDILKICLYLPVFRYLKSPSSQERKKYNLIIMTRTQHGLALLVWKALNAHTKNLNCI